MDNIKLGGIEINIKLDIISVEELRNAINYIFLDLIQTNKKIEFDYNKHKSNKEIESINGNITDKQRKCIYALAKEKDLDKSTLQNYSMFMFGKDSSRSLTKHEASKLIDVLNDLEYNILDHSKI